MDLALAAKQQQRQVLMESIFRQYHAELYAFMASRVQQADIADDLTSIVFLKAYRWLLEDRGMRQVRSWLYSTARTTLVDYWQEQQKHTHLPLLAQEDSPVTCLESPYNEQAQQRVHYLLSLLPAREREVLQLRYFQGYTAAEVGKTLGLTPGHVRVLQLRALRQAALFDTSERQHVSMSIHTLSYTQQGQRVLDLATNEALALQHYYAGPEHLLLGLLAEGSAATPLIEQGITLEHVRSGLIFLVGKSQEEGKTDAPLTPQARYMLERAQQYAQLQGSPAISPQHILRALQSSEQEYGITYGLLQSLGVERIATPQLPVDEDAIASALTLQQQLIEQYPQLSAEEELQLAHTVSRSEREKKRAEYLQETPNAHVLEEGKLAYFRLFMSSQQLVFSIAKEYAQPGKDIRKLFDAGNRGLTYAIHKFGSKTQTSFRAYAAHWIHLEIMESVVEYW